MSKKVLEILENYDILEGYTCLEEDDFCGEFIIKVNNTSEETNMEDSYVDFLDVKV